MRSGCPHGWVLVSIFLASRWSSPHMVKSESETDTQSASFLGFPLVRAHPIGSGPYPYDLIYFHLNYPFRDTSPNTVTLGIRASICEFGKRGHK